MKDTFYDCAGLSEERLRNTFGKWDNELIDESGLRHYHATQLRQCASLLMGETVLDVGCGECHLYDLLKEEIKRYVGVDIDPRIVEMALEKHPGLEIHEGSVYDLSGVGVFDSVYAVGLYFGRPNLERGVREMLDHARLCLVMTYFSSRKRAPFPFLSGVEYDYSEFQLDPNSSNPYIKNLEIVRIRKA